MQVNLFIRSDNSFLFSAITFSTVVVVVAVFFRIQSSFLQPYYTHSLFVLLLQVMRERFTFMLCLRCLSLE